MGAAQAAHASAEWALPPFGSREVAGGQLVVRGDAVVIPAEAEDLIVEALHLGHDGSHWGVEDLMRRLAYCWWKGKQQRARDYVASCRDCQHARAPRTQPAGGELNTAWAGKVHDVWYADHVVATGEGGVVGFLTIMDSLSRSVIARPVLGLGGEEAVTMLREAARMWGAQPKSLTTDGAQALTGAAVTAWAAEHGVTRHITTPYHGSGMGSLARAQRALRETLRALAGTDYETWPRHLPAAEAAWNEHYSHSISASPDEARTGRAAAPQQEVMPAVQVAAEAAQEIAAARAERAALVAGAATVAVHGAKGGGRTFTIGEDVTLWTPAPTKMASCWAGWYRVEGEVAGRRGYYTIRQKLGDAWADGLVTAPTAHLWPLNVARTTGWRELATFFGAGKEGIPHAIMGHRKGEAGVELLVRWEGHDAGADSWETPAALGHVQHHWALVEAYAERVGLTL